MDSVLKKKTIIGTFWSAIDRQAGGRRKADGLCRHETQGKGGERKKKE